MLRKLLRRVTCKCHELELTTVVIKNHAGVYTCVNCGRRYMCQRNLITGEMETHRETRLDREVNADFLAHRKQFMDVDFVKEGVVHDKD